MDKMEKIWRIPVYFVFSCRMVGALGAHEESEAAEIIRFADFGDRVAMYRRVTDHPRNRDTREA